MKSSHDKRARVLITAFAAWILVGAFGSAAMAQNNPIANFDEGYLENHPNIAQQPSVNPDLLDNPQYRAGHPGLQHYLAHHPEVRTELKQNPSAFMNRANQLNSSNGSSPPVGVNGDSFNSRARNLRTLLFAQFLCAASGGCPPA